MATTPQAPCPCLHACVRACERACVCALVRPCLRACVRACVRVCARGRVLLRILAPLACVRTSRAFVHAYACLRVPVRARGHAFVHSLRVVICRRKTKKPRGSSAINLEYVESTLPINLLDIVAPSTRHHLFTIRVSSHAYARPRANSARQTRARRRAQTQAQARFACMRAGTRVRLWAALKRSASTVTSAWRLTKWITINGATKKDKMDNHQRCHKKKTKWITINGATSTHARTSRSRCACADASARAHAHRRVRPRAHKAVDAHATRACGRACVRACVCAQVDVELYMPTDVQACFRRNMEYVYGAVSRCGHVQPTSSA